jgi:hypothetical protein
VLQCALHCNRCRYVSISLPERDCSWYRDCDLGGLQHRTLALTLALALTLTLALALALARPLTLTLTRARMSILLSSLPYHYLLTN